MFRRDHHQCVVLVTRTSELGTDWKKCYDMHILRSVIRLLVTSNAPSSSILVTLMMEALGSFKRRFLQEPHCVTSYKTFFIVTAMKISNLT
jgi:hypothetical protein